MTDTLALLSGSPDSDPDCAVVRESRGPAAQIGSSLRGIGVMTVNQFHREMEKRLYFTPPSEALSTKQKTIYRHSHKHRHTRNMRLTDRHTHSCGCLSL